MLRGVFRSIAAISPFGPVFGMEMRTTAKRGRTYILRTLYLAGLLLLVLYLSRSLDPNRNQEASSQNIVPQSVTQRAAELHEISRHFFRIFSLALVGAMAAVGPILTATSISSERQHRTLDVLMMTPISAWQIVTGKMLSRLLIVLTLVGLSLPAMTLVRLLGGIELWQIAGVLFIALATAFAGAAIGMLYSALLRRPYAIIVMSMATQLCVYLFLPFLQRHMEGQHSFQRQITAINPFLSTINTCNGSVPWRMTYTSFSYFKSPRPRLPFPRAPVSATATLLASRTWRPVVITHLSAAFVLTLFVAWQVRMYSRRWTKGESIAPTGLILGPRESPDQKNDEAGPPKPVGRFRAGRHPTVSENPVRWRELRRPLMTTRRQRYLGSSLVTAALLLTYYAYIGDVQSDFYSDHAHANAVFNLSFFALIGVLAAVLSATAIAGEKEADTWLILLASPLTPMQIISGKLLGLVRRLLWPTALVAGHYAFFIYGNLLHPADALQYVWIIFSFSTLWIATGLYLSLRIRRATVAVILNLLLPIVIYGSAWVIWSNFQSQENWHYGFGEMALWGWPLMYLHPEWRESYLYRDQIASVAPYAGLIHILLATLILTYTTGRFDRIVGRSPVRPFQWRLVPKDDDPTPDFDVGRSTLDVGSSN